MAERCCERDAGPFQMQCRLSTKTRVGRQQTQQCPHLVRRVDVCALAQQQAQDLQHAAAGRLVQRRGKILRGLGQGSDLAWMGLCGTSVFTVP